MKVLVNKLNIQADTFLKFWCSFMLQIIKKEYCNVGFSNCKYWKIFSVGFLCLPLASSWSHVKILFFDKLLAYHEANLEICFYFNENLKTLLICFPQVYKLCIPSARMHI